MIKYGVRINVDNFDELLLISKINKSYSRKIKIGVRLNSNIGNYPWSKFGFNIESGEAEQVVEIVGKQLKNIDIIGLHIHIGTNINKLSFYKKSY